MRIKIDNNEALEITGVNNNGYTNIDLEDGSDWYLFKDSEEAGEEARKYWEDMAQDDPKEFTCMVGEETLIQWGMGHYAGPGSTQVKSLEDWLDLWLDTPEEHFASYDGTESDYEIELEEGEDEPDFPIKGICYRHN